MIGYLKASPTTYVLHFAQGKLRREGAGLSFLYLRPTSTLVAVPLASADLPFAFMEITADFQQVTVQGRLTYRIARPKHIAGILDYSISATGAYLSDDPEKLGERLVQAAQTLSREALEHGTLRQALGAADRLGAAVLEGMRTTESVTSLGVEILDVAITSIRPSPEMARALEAEARESLQRESDLAIYTRRNAAVEQERLIKENELNTEIAVQEKQRRIRETKMAADVAIEEQRAVLIERRSANERKDADARAYALTATLEPLRTVDWRTLTAVGAAGGDPRTMLAVAFRELAENAGKIGTLNISPDLLGTLLSGEKR
jgi:regulator of protease activity HflC (stomatin/prohibitin superfamily)